MVKSKIEVSVTAICAFCIAATLIASDTAQSLIVKLSSSNHETQLSFTLPSTSLNKLDASYIPVFRIDDNQVVDVSIYSRLLGLYSINSREFIVIVSRGGSSTLLTELIEGKTLTIRYKNIHMLPIRKIVYLRPIHVVLVKRYMHGRDCVVGAICSVMMRNM